MRLKILGACAIALAMPNAAMATVTLLLSGTGYGQMAGTASTFTATITYDDAALPDTTRVDPGSVFAFYGSAIQSMTFASGSAVLSFDAATAQTQRTTVFDNSDGNNDTATLYMGGTGIDYLSTTLRGGPATLSSTALTGIGAFAASGPHNLVAHNQLNRTYGGQITSITVVGQGAVPEPATWGMMILGFGAVGYAMRRQRKATVGFA